MRPILTTSAALAFGATLWAPAPAMAQPENVALESSIRPAARPSTKTMPATEVRMPDPAFAAWLAGFEPRARAAGIPAAILRAAFAGVEPDPRVIERDRNQSEFSRTIWEYLDRAVSESRIANGREALAEHRRILEAIEARYGVEKEIVTAVWGLESAYGTFRGEDDVIRSLATLAHDGRRGAFFEQQLIAALKILAAGDVAPLEMKGSWAGAMGHTQFIPTSYLAYAVDGTGDGKRDIWSADPTDALASTAAYLARHGWQTGQPWGIEVRLPEGFDHALSGARAERSAAEWARLGVRGADGGALPDHGPGAIRLPGGARGAAFLTFRNFRVLERYNAADAYVIAVGHLADRIAGGPPIRADWPRDERALQRDERRELQRRLTAQGFDTRGIDGIVGPDTTAAIRAFQRSAGMVADGHASLALLERLR